MYKIMLDIISPKNQVVYHGVTDDPMQDFIDYCAERELDTSTYSYEIRELKPWEKAAHHD